MDWARRLDRRKRGQAFQPGHGMVNRFTTAQSTGAMRRCGPPAIVMLAAVAALTALTADAAARQARPAPPSGATAPRDAGEPIMAIVSIKTQQVAFYDADGWILRAPVSTGTTERETPAGVFAVIEKDKDHHSTMYDDAWMPNMQRITWNGVALHGGPLPGDAASHGCVRMPYRFAENLFDKTRVGHGSALSTESARPLAPTGGRSAQSAKRGRTEWRTARPRQKKGGGRRRRGWPPRVIRRARESAPSSRRRRSKAARRKRFTCPP